MSVSTRKNDRGMDGGRQQQGSGAGWSVPFAHQAQQAAQQAVPAARNAATGAMSKTTPAVDAARSWAAPQLEQSARTISDTLAPMISSALISAARRIEAPDRTPDKSGGRRWGQVAGALLATAAVGAATAIAMRMRGRPDNFSTAVADDSDQFGPVTYVQEDVMDSEPAMMRYDGPDTDVNGHHIV